MEQDGATLLSLCAYGDLFTPGSCCDAEESCLHPPATISFAQWVPVTDMGDSDKWWYGLRTLTLGL